MPGVSVSTFQSGNGTVATLAAAAHQPPQQILRRPPVDWFSAAGSETKQAALTPLIHPFEDAGTGSRLARVQGIVLHALLERAAAGTSGARPDWSRLAGALLRQHGLTSSDIASAHAVILRGLRNALEHEEGRWLLAAREAAPSEQHSAQPLTEEFQSGKSWNEISWTSASNGRVLGQRPDRVFFGGSSPGASGTEYLWIVDYKTAALPEGTSRDSFLGASREQYRSQLESYSELFRKLTELDKAAGQRGHRLAIYHPMLSWLDWWTA
jgi:hypothetical protein